MPNLEWEVPHTLVSSEGTLELNVTPGGTEAPRRYAIQSDYQMVPQLRVTVDNLSQRDGGILHPRLKTPLRVTMTVHYQMGTNGDDVEYEPACGADLREMHDELMKHLNALRFLTDEQQRLLWTPTDYSNRRMLDFVQTEAWGDPTRDPATNETGVTFQLASPFPYAIDLTQTTTSIAEGGSATITLAGSSNLCPVLRVQGPSTEFVITNETTGKLFAYDGSRPSALPLGGAQYAEIDMFRGTIVLNGDILYLDAGIDPEFTDFWTLEPGPNVITADGAAVDVLWNQAWS